MFIVCDYRGNKYGILDTNDGVIEYYTLDELTSMVNNYNLVIKGISINRGNLVVKVTKVPTNWNTNLKEFVNITGYKRKLVSITRKIIGDNDVLYNYFNHLRKSSDDWVKFDINFTNNSCIFEIMCRREGVGNDKFSEEFFDRICRDDIEITSVGSEFNLFKKGVLSHSSGVKSRYTLSRDSYSYVDICSSYLFSIPCSLSSVKEGSFDKTFTNIITKLKGIV